MMGSFGPLHTQIYILMVILIFLMTNVLLFFPSAGLVCVVKPEGVPQLCQTDEIGELCVCSIATGTSYYGLTGMTKNTFEVRVHRLRGSAQATGGWQCCC